MATSSTASGYLLATAGPDEDKELHRTIHDAIAGITGIPGNLVRPRWPLEPDQIPEFEVTWCAFGITVTKRDAFAAVKQKDLVVDLERLEELEVLCSFYGPHAILTANAFSDGLQVDQNRTALAEKSIAVIGCEDTVHVPALVKNMWVKRTDVRLRLRRAITRTYNITTIESAAADLITDTGLVSHVTVSRP